MISVPFMHVILYIDLNIFFLIVLFRKDRDSKFRLILVESRIHRLARYYKRKSKIAPNWRYESSTASALVA